jgi:AraC-like DNA-binding protein
MIGSATDQPIAVIDGAIRFNSYTLSKVAAQLGIAPKTLLRRTYVTRSFTAFQTEAAITAKLPRFLADHACRLVIILGLLDTYYDEQVKPHECKQSLQRIMQTLRALVANNIHVLIADVEIAEPPNGKENLFALINRAADVTAVLALRDDGSYCIEERKTPWDAITIPSRLSLTGTENHGANSAGR